MSVPRDHAISIFNAAVDAVRPSQLVQQVVEFADQKLTIKSHHQGHQRKQEWDIGGFERLIVVGAGKATAAMTQGLVKQVGQTLPVVGWINVPEGTVVSDDLDGITVHPGRPAGLNEPTTAGVVGTKAMIELACQATERDLCIALISGGGSALMPAPCQGITLDDKLEVTRFLSGAGANIGELNTVRKNLSEVKGGGLLEKCNAGELITLVLSDVLGDPLDLIASGPTVPDSSTPEDALAVLAKYDPEQKLSTRIYDVLTKPSESSLSKSKASSTKLSSTTVVIGNNAVAVDAAAAHATEMGYQVDSESAEACEGSAEEIGIRLADRIVRAAEDPKNESGVCLISGGEPTVKLAATDIRGDGGRNQQLVLAAYLRLLESGLSDQQWQRIAILSGGTDGEDGPTDAAGGVLDWQSHCQIVDESVDCADYLRRNDAYHALESAGGLVMTGPTGTNVCDVRVFLVLPDHCER